MNKFGPKIPEIFTLAAVKKTPKWMARSWVSSISSIKEEAENLEDTTGASWVLEADLIESVAKKSGSKLPKRPRLIVLSFSLVLQGHTSQFQDVCSMKNSSKRLQNLPYKWKCCKYKQNYLEYTYLVDQSFTSLMANLRQDINRVSSFTKCLMEILIEGIAPLRHLVH